MSKFRARQLDATKPIPIYLQEDISDYSDLNNASNRTVPQMPTGMEKEEETEHHLQQAIFHHRVIPVPEVYPVDHNENEKIYPTNYKQPRQLIHIHPFSAEQDIPDYDLDSDDEDWLSQQAAKGELLPLHPPQFEEMMDRLEKSSGLKAVTLQEAKVLLKDDDDLITAVYDYWLNKRLKLQHALIPQVQQQKVKSEKGVGSAPSDPYIAFRKRTEKMQTRKNRKNDESSYEKMLKLRRDLSKSSNMLQMVGRREKTKRELLHLEIEIYEKRFELQDWGGVILLDVETSRAQIRSAFTPLVSNHMYGSSAATAGGGNATAAATGATAVAGAAVAGGWLKMPAGHHLHPSSPHTHSHAAHRDKVSRKREKSKRERKYRKLKHRSSGQSAAQQQQQQHLAYNHPPDPYLLASAYPTICVGGVAEEDDQSASAVGAAAAGASPSDDDSHVDGMFTFVRRHHCQYYAPHEDGVWAASHEGGGGLNSQYSLMSLPDHFRPQQPSFPQQCPHSNTNASFVNTSSLPHSSSLNVPTQTLNHNNTNIPSSLISPQSSTHTPAFSSIPQSSSSPQTIDQHSSTVTIIPSILQTSSHITVPSISQSLVHTSSSTLIKASSQNYPHSSDHPQYKHSSTELPHYTYTPEQPPPAPPDGCKLENHPFNSFAAEASFAAAAASPPRRHVTLARRRIGRGGRMWVDRIGVSPPSASLEEQQHHNGLTSHTAELLNRLHAPQAACSSTSGTNFLSSLPTFVAPPSSSPDGGLSDGGDTDMEVDVENVVVTSCREGGSPRRGSYSTATATSSARIMSPPPLSLLLTAEMLDGVYEGAATDVEISLAFASNSQLDVKLEECPVDYGKDEFDSTDGLDSASAPFLRSSSDNCTSRADVLLSSKGFHQSSSSFNSLHVIDNTPGAFMDNSDNAESPFSLPASSSGQNSAHRTSPVRHSVKRRRSINSKSNARQTTSSSSRSHHHHQLQHSSQFSLQPNSKFVVNDNTCSSSMAGFQFTSISPICSYTINSSSCDGDLASLAQPSFLSAPSSSSSASSSIPVTSSTLLSSSSLSLLNTCSTRQNTLSNQSSSFVITNSSCLTSVVSSPSTASEQQMTSVSRTANTTATIVTSAAAAAAINVTSVTAAAGGSGSVVGGGADSCAKILLTTSSSSQAAAVTRVSWTTSSSSSGDSVLAVNNNSNAGATVLTSRSKHHGNSSSVPSNTSVETTSFSSPSTGDSLLTTTTTTSDNDNGSSGSGTCIVNSVDSSNKLTSISSSPVSTSLLQSQSSVTSNNQQRPANSSNYSSSSTLNNNSSNAHEVVYLNARSNNNGNSVLSTSNSPSLRSHHRVLTARTQSNVSSNVPNNSLKSPNSGGGVAGAGGDVSSNNTSSNTNNANLTNGPSRNNVILSKTAANNTTTSSSTTPTVKCAKLDQYLFRDS